MLELSFLFFLKPIGSNLRVTALWNPRRLFLLDLLEVAIEIVHFRLDGLLKAVAQWLPGSVFDILFSISEQVKFVLDTLPKSGWSLIRTNCWISGDVNIGSAQQLIFSLAVVWSTFLLHHHLHFSWNFCFGSSSLISRLLCLCCFLFLLGWHGNTRK